MPPVVVGPIETLTVIIERLQRENAELRAQRDLSFAETLRLRRLLQRVLGQLTETWGADRVADATKPPEGEE